MKKLFLLLVLVGILIGCADSQPTNEQITGEVPDIEDTPEEEIPEAPEKQEVKEIIEEESNLDEDFIEHMESTVDLEFQVEYDMTGTASGTFKQYFKDGKMRFDTEAQGVETQTFILGDDITSCFNTGSWTCAVLPEYEGETSSVDKQIQGNPDQYNVETIAGKTIAGTTTECFRIEKNDDEQVEYCFSPESVPLYVKTINKGEVISELTATSYGVSVSDSVFELPAEPGAGFDPSQFY